MELLKRFGVKREKQDSDDKNFESSEEILLEKKLSFSIKHSWRITVDWH